MNVPLESLCSVPVDPLSISSTISFGFFLRIIFFFWMEGFFRELFVLFSMKPLNFNPDLPSLQRAFRDQSPVNYFSF